MRVEVALRISVLLDKPLLELLDPGYELDTATLRRISEASTFTEDRDEWQKRQAEAAKLATVVDTPVETKRQTFPIAVLGFGIAILLLVGILIVEYSGFGSSQEKKTGEFRSFLIMIPEKSDAFAGIFADQLLVELQKMGISADQRSYAEADDLVGVGKTIAGKKIVDTKTLVLDGFTDGRIKTLNVSEFNPAGIQVIWSSASSEPNTMTWVDDGVADLLALFAGAENLPRTGVGTTEPLAFKAYLLAKKTLEKHGSGSLDAIAKANNQLASAIALDPDFVDALALQCRAASLQYYYEDSAIFLGQAEKACAKALALNEKSLLAISSYGLYLSRSGQPAEARDYLSPLLRTHPDNVRLRLALAEASSNLGGSTDDRRSVDLAVTHARAAVTLDPDFWQSHFWLGTYLWLAEEVDEGVAVLAHAARLNPVEATLANSGTFAVCLGQLDLAEELYSRILEDYPESNLGFELLAKVRGLQGDHAEEVRMRELALRLMAETTVPFIHAIHGSLGDAYFYAGRLEEARASYVSAIEVLKMDEATQGLGANDRAAWALYLSQLAVIDRSKDGHAVAEILVDVEQDSLNFLGHVRMARVAKWQEEESVAREHWAAAVATCPVYAMDPAYISPL